MLPITAHPTIVEKYAQYFSKHFNNPAFNHFKAYLTGLITGERLTVSAISSRIVGGKHQSSLNRFLTASPWDSQAVNNTRVRLLQNDPRLRVKPSGYGIIDDTLTHKTGKKIEAVGKLYDHSLRKFILGHDLLTSFYADDNKRWPINHQLYFKKQYCLKHHQVFKTKIELAGDLVDEAYEKELDIKFWLFDSWYLTKKLIDKVESYQANWVSEAKLNRLVLTAKGPVPLREYLRKDIPKKAYKKVSLNDKPRYYFTKAVVLKSLGGRRVRILALFDKKDLSDKPKVLVTNKLNWTSPKKIWQAYEHRWSQETFYRDSKQNLGLESYQLRSVKAIQRHWCLVELAYTLLTIARVESPVLKRVSAQITTLGKATKMVSQEVLRSFVYWIHKQLVHGQDNPDHVCQLLFAALPASSPMAIKG